jgi:nucleotide-binding universal stress UspA family protein
MTRTIEPAAAPAPAPNVVPARAILVATDGTHDADGAVRVGHALALRDNVTADVFSVVEPPSLVDADGAPIPDIDQLVAIAHESRSAALLSQRDRTHPGIHDWPFTVAVGPRVETIIKRATETDASIILLGLGSHGVAARLNQRETALRVIRAAGKPILAVPSVGWGVPHTVLAAIDFTASSEHAARAALELLGGEGTLYLAHVLPRVPIPQGDSRTWEEITTSAVMPKLDAVRRRLDPSPGIDVEFVLLHGDPAHELLAFAEQTNIDIIAAGMHGRSALGRLVLGSVSTKLIRTAACSVLVAPPHRDQGRAEAAPADGEAEAEPPNVWW